MRFSLRWLFAAMAFAALGCSSLVYASDAMSAGVSGLLWLLLGLSTLGAIFGRRSGRAFYGGFAIIGLAYIASDYLPTAQVSRPSQVVAVAIRRLYSVMKHDAAFDRNSWSSDKSLQMERGVWRSGNFYVTRPRKTPFYVAGHALAALLLAAAGGVAASRFASQYARPPGNDAPTPSDA